MLLWLEVSSRTTKEEIDGCTGRGRGDNFLREEDTEEVGRWRQVIGWSSAEEENKNVNREGRKLKMVRCSCAQGKRFWHKALETQTNRLTASPPARL